MAVTRPWTRHVPPTITTANSWPSHLKLLPGVNSVGLACTVINIWCPDWSDPLGTLEYIVITVKLVDFIDIEMIIVAM
jgi:hypothetical protein